MSELNGVLNILKPSGMTSHDVVYKVRKKFNIQKVGHTGTLDPNVSGVLPILVGKATKLSNILMDKDKNYRCVMSFGKKTDTSDSYGNIVEIGNIPESFEEVHNIFNSFLGEIQQIPSMFSAIKVNGQKLYKLARKGEVLDDIPVRTVTVHSLDILEYTQKSLMFDICCSKGTYVRSIVEDISKSLGTVGYMNLLIRTKSGHFDIKDSVPINDISIDNIIPIEDININGAEKIVLEDVHLKRYINGLKVTKEYLNVFKHSSTNIYKIYDKSGNIVSIGNFVEEQLKNIIML